MTEVFQNKGIRILLFTNALVLISSAMLNPIYAFLVEDVGGDLLDASFAGTAMALTAAITTFLIGKFSDRVKENELFIIFGYLLIATAYYLLMLADSIVFLFITQIMIGFGEAIYSPAFDAVYSKHVDVKKAGVQWGAWEAMNYTTLAAGALIGGLIVSMFGFDALFLIMGSISLFSALYILILPRKVL